MANITITMKWRAMNVIIVFSLSIYFALTTALHLSFLKKLEITYEHPHKEILVGKWDYITFLQRTSFRRSKTLTMAAISKQAYHMYLCLFMSLLSSVRDATEASSCGPHLPFSQLTDLPVNTESCILISNIEI